MIDLNCPLELPQPKPRIKPERFKGVLMYRCNGYLGYSPKRAYEVWAWFEKEGPRC